MNSETLDTPIAAASSQDVQNEDSQSSHEPITFSLTQPEDVIEARRIAREIAKQIGFGLADQTRFVTAVAELAHNALKHAGSGKMQFFDECNAKWNRLRVVVEDQGPGIAKIEDLLSDEFYSERNVMGLGLPGVKRLATEFHIRSTAGRTYVEIALVRLRHEV